MKCDFLHEHEHIGRVNVSSFLRRHENISCYDLDEINRFPTSTMSIHSQVLMSHNWSQCWFICYLSLLSAGIEGSVVSDLCDEYFDLRLKESPEYASKYGFPVWQSNIEEWNEEAFARRLVNAHVFTEPTINIITHILKCSSFHLIYFNIWLEHQLWH